MNRNNKNDKFVIKKTKNTNRRIIIRTTDEMADEIFELQDKMKLMLILYL